MSACFAEEEADPDEVNVLRTEITAFPTEGIVQSGIQQTCHLSEIMTIPPPVLQAAEQQADGLSRP